jgi:hypothetical protein
VRNKCDGSGSKHCPAAASARSSASGFPVQPSARRFCAAAKEEIGSGEAQPDANYLVIFCACIASIKSLRKMSCARLIHLSNACSARGGFRTRDESHRDGGPRCGRCTQPEISSPNQTINSVQNFIFEDSDEPLIPENEGGSFSVFRWSHVK